jgi:hypothetical protein
MSASDVMTRARSCGDRSAMKNMIPRENTSATVPMMTTCDRQLPKTGSVTAAMPAARKLPPTGPQVQNPNAVARPNRGEKSRTRPAVVVTAAPSTNSSRQRNTSNCAGVCTTTMAMLHKAASNSAGTRSRTRPCRSASRPPIAAETPPTATAAAPIRPYVFSDIPRSSSSSGTTGEIWPSKLTMRLANTAISR